MVQILFVDIDSNNPTVSQDVLEQDLCIPFVMTYNVLWYLQKQPNSQALCHSREYCYLTARAKIGLKVVSIVDD